MGFLESYKHLDNLCKDMNDIGVTGYIDEMKQKRNGSFYVENWQDDFSNLKKYRAIRNRIAHENYVSEEDLCSYEDAEWIENFYTRIMRETDPLTLYRKKTGLRQTKKITKKNEPIIECKSEIYEEKRFIKNFFALILLIAAIVALIFALFVIITKY